MSPHSDCCLSYFLGASLAAVRRLQPSARMNSGAVLMAPLPLRLLLTNEEAGCPALPR